MQTLDLINEMSPATRSIGAHRWGVKATTPRVLAAQLREPRAASRICRRGADCGAHHLARLMVEYGGHLVPRTPGLDVEARRLGGWFPLIATDAGYRVPRDFATAAVRFAERERFFAATLIARVRGTSGDDLLADLGIGGVNTRADRVQRALDLIQDAPVSPTLAEAAKNVESIGSLPAKEIRSVTYVAGSGGLCFMLEREGAEPLVVCPREIAEKMGVVFAPDTPVETRPVGAERRAPSVKVPPLTEVGAIVTFATARAAEEAFRATEFRSVAVRRVDERRVATRPGCDAAAARAVLVKLGFHIDAEVR